MKANAPEKIYVSNNRSGILRFAVNDIEYVRADAFIEKACVWFKEHKEAIAILGYIPDYYIEDFKNYMEGYENKRTR